MKSREEALKSIGNITENETKKLEYLKYQIDTLLTKNVVDEEGLKTLENMVQELTNIHTSYKWRIIRLLKQGNEF